MDAPIGRYLPGVVVGAGYDENAITVRQLLRHTSGVVREPIGAWPQPDGRYTLAELVRAGLARPPLHAPDAGFAYSNVGYYILGMLVERLTGRSYGTVLAERVLLPLGLTSTSYPTARTLPGPYLPAYDGFRFGTFFLWYDVTTSVEPSLYGPAGAVVSTLSDLTAFQRAFVDGRLVSKTALAQMRQTVGNGVDYGLGLIRMRLTCGGDAWGHTSDIPFGHSSLTMVTDDGRSASLVTNTMVLNHSAEPTAYSVIDTALCETSA